MPTRILDLADELLRIILEHVASEPEKLISLDRRAYLSQESFFYSPPEPDNAENLKIFRLVCKRFADLGAIHQFARLTVRFSKRSFKRLERVANEAHLAKRVKKVSYMVPCFLYVEGYIHNAPEYSVTLTRVYRPRESSGLAPNPTP
jgi:hypothetical protein